MKITITLFAFIMTTCLALAGSVVNPPAAGQIGAAGGMLSDGSIPMSGTLDMGGNSITNIGTNSLTFMDGTKVSVLSNGVLGVSTGGTNSPKTMVDSGNIATYAPTPPTYYADGPTLLKSGTTFSVQPWITDNLIALRYETWNHWASQTMGLLDGPGYWFSDEEGIYTNNSSGYTYTDGYRNLIADQPLVSSNYPPLPTNMPTTIVVLGTNWAMGSWLDGGADMDYVYCGGGGGAGTPTLHFGKDGGTYDHQFACYINSGPDYTSGWDPRGTDWIGDGANGITWPDGGAWLGGGTTITDMTICLNATILTFTPAYTFASCLIEVGTNTLSTSNLVMSASRDNGTTWSTGAVTLASTWATSNVLATASITLTNQPTGSNVLFKLSITNSPPLVTVKGMAAPCGQ